VRAGSRTEEDRRIAECTGSWDHVSYTTPMYYSASEIRRWTFEYRIPVEWCIDLSKAPRSPVGVTDMLRRFGYNPRGTIHRIHEQRAVAVAMVGELL
jgi:hypothetical protein